MTFSSYLLILFHLLPWTIGMGAAFYFVFGAVPLSNRIAHEEDRLRSLRFHIKFYHITFLIAMSIMVITGAFRLTDYKIAFGTQYFHKVAYVLIFKLLIFLVIYLLAAYQSFGLALRVTGTGAQAMEDQVSSEVVMGVVQKMKLITYLNLLLMSVAGYLGLILSRMPFLN
jgi:hypothetical protein